MDRKKRHLLRKLRRFVRSTIQPFLLEYRWILILLIAILALILGIVGFNDTARAQGEIPSFTDLIYLSVQLFVFQSGANYYYPTWPLDIARFLAPATTLTTIAILVLRSFQRQFEYFWLRFLTRYHMVICGMGYLGPEIAREFLGRGYEVVVIEKNADNKKLQESMDLGAMVIVGDATEEYILRRAQVQKAKCLFLVTGDDEINSRIAILSRQIIDGQRREPLNCYIHIVDPKFANILKIEQLALAPRDPLRIEFFNLYQIAAYCLFEKHKPFPESLNGIPDIHIAIIGLGRMGERLLVHLVKAWKEAFGASGKKIRISFVDRKADIKTELLHMRYPALSKYCELIPIQAEIESPAFLKGEYLCDSRGHCDITAVYICVSNETLAFSTGLIVHAILNNPHIRIIVRTPFREGFAAFFNEIVHDKHGFKNFFAFPLVCGPCCLNLILKGTREFLAQAIHEDYITQRQKEGETPQTNPSMRSWREIPHYMRESNRKQADHIGERLQSIGCGVTIRSDWDESLFVFTPEEFEKLAKMEHQRWMDERKAAGYTYGSTRDEKNKTHPSLVPWEELPESEKKKDRDTIVAIPRILATVDLKIIRLNKIE